MSEDQTQEVMQQEASVEQAPEELLQQVEGQQQSASIQDAAPPAAPDPSKQEYAITVGGKEVKGTIDQLRKWASMGYEAPNKIGQLNQQLEQWKQKEAQFKEWQEKYSAVDEYAKQNPQWWNHVTKNWEQVSQQMNENNPLLQELNSLKATVQDLAQYKNNIVMQQEDKVYEEEKSKITQQFPDVDLHSPGEDGKSLEYKVLEHAQKMGIKNFTTAFRDFYHDEIVKRASEKAKEQVVKEKQTKSRLGIVGQTAQPITKQFDVRGKSYNQLAEDIFKELNLN
jgi:hypothetical protein